MNYELWTIEDALVRHGIEIPFPQVDLRMRSWFGLEAQSARQAAGPPPGAEAG